MRTRDHTRSHKVTTLLHSDLQKLSTSKFKFVTSRQTTRNHSQIYSHIVTRDTNSTDTPCPTCEGLPNTQQKICNCAGPTYVYNNASSYRQDFRATGHKLRNHKRSSCRTRQSYERSAVIDRSRRGLKYTCHSREIARSITRSA